jgi:hypothetical protein
MKVANHFGTKLTLLDLRECKNITDQSIIRVAQQCSELESLNVVDCYNITDISILEIAKMCPHLLFLFVSDLENDRIRITFDCIRQVKTMLPNLKMEYHILHSAWHD